MAVPTNIKTLLSGNVRRGREDIGIIDGVAGRAYLHDDPVHAAGLTFAHNLAEKCGELRRVVAIGGFEIILVVIVGKPYCSVIIGRCGCLRFYRGKDTADHEDSQQYGSQLFFHKSPP